MTEEDEGTITHREQDFQILIAPIEEELQNNSNEKQTNLSTEK